jgi:hypothetical protein
VSVFVVDKFGLLAMWFKIEMLWFFS